jgi:hypothetical protein
MQFPQNISYKSFKILTHAKFLLGDHRIFDSVARLNL